MSHLVYRKTVQIGSDTYAEDVYKGAPPAISPGDTLASDGTATINGTTYSVILVKKGGAPPPPPPGGDTVTALDVSASTTQGTPVTIDPKVTLSNPKAGIASYSIEIIPAHGTVTITTAGEFSYTPNSGFTGPDSFKYSATDNLTPPNKSNDGTVSVMVTTSPPPPSKLDEFGHPKKYDDAASGNYFALKDSTFDRCMEQKPVKLSGGWYTFPNQGEGRIEALSSNAATEKSIPTFNIKKILEQQNGVTFKDPSQPDGDFGDFEFTWVFKMIQPGGGSHGGPSHCELVPGILRQTSETQKAGADGQCPASCEAGSIHSNTYPDGRVKLEKDSEHTTGYAVNSSDPERKGFLGNIMGKEVVQKMVVYRVPGDATWKFFLKIEVYYDVGNTGHFVQAFDFLDKGQWGPTRGGNGACCGNDSKYQYVVLWMSRCAIGWRCDGWSDFQYKDVTIRSIDKNKPLF